uniref:Uncharacterized protein n=1 Tax=Glossina morsitans morsitans TaxID=37546 RepID=A0A1B0FMW7_GLOMM
MYVYGLLVYKTKAAMKTLAKKQAYHSNDHNDDQATSSYIYKNDHIKCGEVFTWLCEGEFFAVECHLCEDRPLCPLSEYAQHMEVWHIEWGEVWLGGCRALTAKNNDKTNQTYDEIDDSQAGSSSCEREGREDFLGNLEEQTLEPFEQVLIEEDLQFQYHRRQMKVTTEQFGQLITLYRDAPCLWDQSDPQFCDAHHCKQVWQKITAAWNESCKRHFSTTNIRMRMSNLCRRYLKEKERRQLKDELADSITFPYYEQMQFLENQTLPLQKRKEFYEKQNSTILEIYRNFPLLWHVRYYKTIEFPPISKDDRKEAYSLQDVEALETPPTPEDLWDTTHPNYNKHNNKQRSLEILCSRLQQECQVQLTLERVKQRLTDLKCQYRLAKKQRLDASKQEISFRTDFEYYEHMTFLDQHVAPFICDMCQTEFKRFKDFNLHQRREHEKYKRGRKQVMPLTPSDESEHVCHICGFTFTLRHNLRLHLQRHEGIRNHPCCFCPKRFYNSYSLKVHERSHTKDYPFTCEKCGQRFAIASKLNLHIKRHSGKCEYACGHCSKSFYTAFERDRHVRWHLNIRDKVCPTCGKTFVSGSSYYTHLMLHKEVKRYVCDKCDKRFAQHSGLYKHKKRHHQ